MEIKELLPIGTVVLLKNAEKKVMVFGIKQTSTDGEEEEYDYIGVMYPEGYLGGEYQFLFNHEDIGTIIYTGYEDDERKNFIDKLSQYYKEA